MALSGSKKLRFLKIYQSIKKSVLILFPYQLKPILQIEVLNFLISYLLSINGSYPHLYNLVLELPQH